jgi:hypothetical protein
MRSGGSAVSTQVTVEADLYERMYLKTVLVAGGGVRDVPPGESPAPGTEVLARAGEPAFRISLKEPVRSDDDVPDEVGHALRRATDRIHTLGRDGLVSTDGMTAVEWTVGPAVHEGAVVMYLDTDGSGAGPALVRSMTNIIVEELESADCPAVVGVPSEPFQMLVPWASSQERGVTD